MVFLSYLSPLLFKLLFFFNDTATTEIYTLSLHDALPICRDPRHLTIHTLSPLARLRSRKETLATKRHKRHKNGTRSEEHTSELQSRRDLVCRLLLEKKKKIKSTTPQSTSHTNKDKQTTSE